MVGLLSHGRCTEGANDHRTMPGPGVSTALSMQAAQAKLQGWHTAGQATLPGMHERGASTSVHNTRTHIHACAGRAGSWRRLELRGAQTFACIRAALLVSSSRPASCALAAPQPAAPSRVDHLDQQCRPLMPNIHRAGLHTVLDPRLRGLGGLSSMHTGAQRPAHMQGGRHMLSDRLRPVWAGERPCLLLPSM